VITDHPEDLKFVQKWIKATEPQTVANAKRKMGRAVKTYLSFTEYERREFWNIVTKRLGKP
jgi:hypothetical protein